MPDSHNLITRQIGRVLLLLVVVVVGIFCCCWFFFNLFARPCLYAEEGSFREDGSHILPHCSFSSVRISCCLE